MAGFWLLMIFAAADLILLACLFLASRHHNGLLWMSWYGRQPMHKERCEMCDGCGVQMLDHGKWIILPHSQRGYTKLRKSMEFKAGNPNVRKCPACLGQTFRWQRHNPQH